MRRAYIIFSILACCILGADVNAAVARGGSARGGAATATSGGRAPVSARAATTGAAKTVSARSATTPAAPKTVAARAATTQKVVNTGTKVAAATANGTVSDACKNLYYGCMDSFCMVDNTSGGRCLCSDRNAELDVVANEIQKLDEQTYAMATSGVERIEMGEMANDVINQAKDIANSFTNTNSETKKKRQSLDLTMWTSAIDFDEDGEEKEVSLLDGKVGAGLHDAVYDMCSAQIANKNPECNAELSMLKLMYSQQIKSDCTAYENSLKQQKKSSAQKLMAAETALRDAAMEQYKSANKYDLGQCTVEFKKCMMTTAGCGDDFSKCASMAVLDNTNAETKSSKNKSMKHSIKGATTEIEISATTYDTLMAKKPICESITKSCVKVGDKVWDTFLSEVAPQLKSAELIAEDNARQNCISSVSSCFQKACKDNIDPNDPDGSYDMCLTRPETMLNFCKIPLNACGISTDTKKKSYEKSSIWSYIKAVMASMRVDSCTNEFKECLQSPDRCGDDYSQCIGLDFESIQGMCPLDKLVGCQQNGKGAVFSNADDNTVDVTSILQGIFLSVDNAMLDQCQNIVTQKMIEICGDTADCDLFTDDQLIGTGSIVVSRDRDGDYVMDGLISFNNVSIDRSTAELKVDDYLKNLSNDNVDDEVKSRIKNTLAGITSAIERNITQMSADPKVNMCVAGRDMSQIRGGDRDDEKSRTKERFPHLLDSYKVVMANSALRAAKRNYDAEYAKYFAEAISGASEYKNQLYCMAMAQGGEFTSELTDLKESGIKESSLAKMVIYGETNENMLKALTKNKEITRVHTETDDPTSKMIARETISSVYEPGTQICRITNTIYPCTGFEAIYNSESRSDSGGGGVSVFGIGVNASGATSRSSTTYQGNFCAAFAEPIISEQALQMGVSGNYLGTTSTRSNLTSYYNDQSSYVEDNSKGGTSVGLSLSTGDLSNIGNGNTRNVTKNTTKNSGIGSGLGSRTGTGTTTGSGAGGGSGTGAGNGSGAGGGSTFGQNMTDQFKNLGQQIKSIPDMMKNEVGSFKDQAKSFGKFF